MAKPIAATPDIRGEAAEEILKEMVHGSPDTPARRETITRADRAFKDLVERGNSPFAVR